MRYLLKLVILGFILSVPPVAAGELQWLGLFKWDMVAWLENTHRLKDLCPDSLSIVDKTLCLIEKRKPLSLPLKVYAEPDGDVLGELTVTATPTQGLSAVFQATDSTEAVEFKPDLYDADWRYGPYFHQTVLARQGNWFRLAQNPFPQPVWLNGDDLGEKIPLETVADDKVYRLGGKSVVIIAVDTKTVTLARNSRRICGVRKTNRRR